MVGGHCLPSSSHTTAFLLLAETARLDCLNACLIIACLIIMVAISNVKESRKQSRRVQAPVE